MYPILIISLSFFIILLFIFCFKKEFYKPPNYTINKFPFYEYNYLNQYFQLYYNSNKKELNSQVQKFFSNVSILFISLKRNKERVNNIQSIIRKYNLKNTYINFLFMSIII